MPIAQDTDQIIIKFKEESAKNKGLLNAMSNGSRSPNSKAMSRLSALAESNLVYKRSASAGSHVMKLDKKKSLKEVRGIVKKLAADTDLVEYAEPDIRMFPMATTPNDAFFADYQWHLQGPESNGINLTEGWDYTTGSSEIVVAVVDTGIRYDHPDFDPSRLLPGYDMVSGEWQGNDGDGRDSDATDPGNWVTPEESAATGYPVAYSTWHGTHVAGTIGAATNNALGVAGVDWNAKILPVRVLGKGGGYLSDIADGISWAAGLSVPGVPLNPSPANVINLSLGGSGTCDGYMGSAINAAQSSGAVIVAAAGNEAVTTNNVTPANCPNVITVAAHGNDGKLSSYSNYGPHVDVLAPGGDGGNFCTFEQVVSLGMIGNAYPEDYSVMCQVGTSMAAPHVSGLVSLMLSIDPSLTAAEAATHIRSGTRPFISGDRCHELGCGAGIADAAQTLAAVAESLPPESEAVCSEPHIQLETQQDVDGFQAKYGNGGTCNVVTGSLTIRSYFPPNTLDYDKIKVTNLDGLSALKRVGALGLTNTYADGWDIGGLENITEISGNLSIYRSGLRNLDQLPPITSLGALTLQENDRLENIDGLAALRFLRGTLKLSYNGVLTNIDGLSNLNTFDGYYVTVYENPLLANLDGLSNVNYSRTGNAFEFSIHTNEKLASVEGLGGSRGFPENVSHLQVIGNASLESLGGFEQLRSVANSAKIENNASLSDCSALSYLLDNVDDGNAGPGGAGSIPDVGQASSIYGNAPGCNAVDEIIFDSDFDGVQDHRDAFPLDPAESIDSDGDGYGDNQDVFPEDPSEWLDSDGDGFGDNADAFPDDPERWEGEVQLVACTSASITLFSQEDVDMFQTRYGSEKDCNSAESIHFYNDYEDPIRNVDGLSSLTRVGYLRIVDQTNLENIDGLSSLKHVDTLMLGLAPERASSLANLEALSGLESLGGLFLWGLDSVSTLRPLGNVKELSGKLSIREMDALTTLDGLDSVKLTGDLDDTGNTIIIESNAQLESLNGLSSVKHWPYVQLIDNPKLTDVSVLASAESMGGLKISNNPSIQSYSHFSKLQRIGLLNLAYGGEEITSLEGFEKLEVIEQGLDIHYHSALADLNAFASLRYVGGRVKMTGNSSLHNCSSLRWLLDNYDDGETGPGDPVGIPDLAHPAETTFERNSPGCNSIEEIVVDTDGDGVPDHRDRFPKDPTEVSDSDGDGVGDNRDEFPSDASEWRDSDNDGVGDNADAFPNDPLNGENPDRDGDGIDDGEDSFPDDPSEWQDSDGDGVGDNRDSYPYDPNRSEPDQSEETDEKSGLSLPLIKAIIEKRGAEDSS
ncbi:MAG: S8 family serine peptidase [Halioglobus sp.]